jgi:peptidoglycan/xylan/chitin deacetylase (PgdA/CDA1 family)
MRRGWRLAGIVLVALGVLAGALVRAPATADLHFGGPVPVRLAGPTLTVRQARLRARVDVAIDRVLGYTSTLRAGGSRRREVALTFDDGPSPYTPAIIAVLTRLHVPATFFPTAKMVAAYPAIARQELEVGVGIGDHTVTHPFLAALSSPAQRAEILGAADRLRAAGAPFPRFFRPPYESFDQATLDVARAAHMLMVLWSVDTRDFSRPGARRIVATAVSGARPGAIILMHDGGGPREQTVAALPRLVRDLRARRFNLVTVGRMLLEDPPPRPGPPARGRHVRAVRPPRAAAARGRARGSGPAARGGRAAG